MRSSAPSSRSGPKEIIEYAAAEKTPQDILEIGEVAEVRPLKTTTAKGTPEAIMAEPVIGRSLLRIAEHLVSLSSLFEFLLRFLITRISIGMKLQGHLSI